MAKHEVTIYSTSTCHYCTVAKDFFRSHNIEYTEYNVGLDAEKRMEMVDLTGQMGVPVIVVDGVATVGFNESHLRDALGMNGHGRSDTNSPDGEAGGSVWSRVRSVLGLE